MIKIPFGLSIADLYLYICESDALGRPLQFEFLGCINSKRMQDWKNNTTWEKSPFGKLFHTMSQAHSRIPKQFRFSGTQTKIDLCK